MDELTKEQHQAFELLQSGENVFLTGEAGSGKSFVVRKFMQDKDPKAFPILASTGAAAVIVGGRTFHSFFGLGIMEGGVEATIEKAVSNKRVVKRLQSIEGFVIDEVMEKVEKPKGLIRYTSIRDLEDRKDKKKRLNIRSLTYLVVILIMIAAFVFVLGNRNSVDLKIIRAIEAPYSIAGDVLINHFRLVVVNQGQTPFVIERPDVEGVDFIGPEFPVTLSPGVHRRVHFFIKLSLSGAVNEENIKIVLNFPVNVQGAEDQQITREVKILKP